MKQNKTKIGKGIAQSEWGQRDLHPRLVKSTEREHHLYISSIYPFPFPFPLPCPYPCQFPFSVPLLHPAAHVAAPFWPRTILGYMWRNGHL